MINNFFNWFKVNWFKGEYSWVDFIFKFRVEQWNNNQKKNWILTIKKWSIIFFFLIIELL